MTTTTINSISDPTTATPAEIDAVLATLWTERDKATAFAKNYDDLVQRERKAGHDAYADRYEAAAKEQRAILSRVRAAIAPLHAEFTRRGGWNRYFLVTNSNGHVHREMTCTTCFPSTQYAWLPELSDCDEAVMIEEFGEKACTVCFPDAPANPHFNGPGRRNAEAKAERERERAERQAVKDAKNLAPELQFRDLGDWKVTTVAGAKTALRQTVETQVVAGTHADYNGYEGRRLGKAVEIYNTARGVLLAKGLSVEEIDKIVASATKKVRKEWSL